MKKQLLSLAMLASVFVVGNAFAANESEGTPSTTTETTTQSTPAPEATTTTAQATPAPTTDEKEVKPGFLTKWIKNPVKNHGIAFAAGVVVTTAAKLVYDHVVNNSADAEEEDEEDNA